MPRRSAQCVFKYWQGFIWLLISGWIAMPVLAETLSLEVGMQQRYQAGQAIERIAVGDPAVADVTMIDAGEVLITPLSAGSTSLMIWPRKGNRVQQLTLNISAAETKARESLEQMDDPAFSVGAAGEQLQLQGDIPSLEQHAAVRHSLGFDDENGIDRSTITGSSQVQIDIKIVEISKSRLQSAGFFLGKGLNGRTPRALASPGGITGASIDGSGVSLSANPIPESNAFNLIYGRQSNGLLAALSMLEGNGFAYTLAEPSLIAMSGQSANFLAGGEFPIPVRGGGFDNSVTIEYKEFGVRLSLTPTVLDKKRIALKVAPEVSELDFNAGIQTGGGDSTGITGTTHRYQRHARQWRKLCDKWLD